MSKKMKVAMIASLIAPIVLGAQPTYAEKKLANPTANVPMNSGSQSDVEKLIDEVYDIYNKVMKNKNKITSKAVREDERDLDHAVNKLVIKFQREILTDRPNRASNKKILQEVLEMKHEVSQLVKQEIAEKREEKEKEIRQEAKETEALNSKILKNSVKRMNDVINSKEGTSTFAAVTDWDSLKKELEAGTPDIQLTKSIKATSKAVVKAGATVNIMGADDVTVDIGKFTIELGEGAQVSAEHLNFIGDQDGIVFTGKGDLTLRGEINALEGTKAPLVQLPDNSLTLDGAKVSLPKGLLRDSNPQGTSKYLGHMDSKNWLVEGSTIDSNASAIFVQSSHKLTNDEAVITISDGSKITGISMGAENPAATFDEVSRAESSASNYNTDMLFFSRKVKFNMLGNTTNMSLKTDSVSADKGNPAVMSFGESYSEINLDGATLDVDAEHISALLSYGEGTEFNLSNQSRVNLHQHDDFANVGEDKGIKGIATLRFAQEMYGDRRSGSNKFIVSGNSEFTVTKDSGAAPAIRMYGDSNGFYTKEGSDITILQNAPLDSMDEGSSVQVGNFAAIFYGGGETGTAPNMFKIESTEADKGDFAQVNLSSEAGPAISNNKGEIDIQADENTFFTARGNILNIGAVGKEKPSATIDSKDTLNFEMNKMSYFDFKNSYKDDKGNPSKEARIFNTAKSDSVFVSKTSDLAVWPSGTDVEGTPMDSWPIMDVKADGAGFNTLDLDGTTNQGFIQNYDKYKFGELSRITANNQAPIIDQLRVPTNADKFIYGHALVPEGKFDMPRDAYPGEVFVELDLYDDKGNVTPLKGHTDQDEGDVDGGKTIYGESKRKGIFEIPVPDGKYLELGQWIRTTAAWRSVENPEEGVHISNKEHLPALEQTVQDVTPPDTPVVDRDKISYVSKEITGYAKEPGTIKLARGDSEMLPTQVETEKEETEGKGYKFKLPIPPEVVLNEGDQLTVLSRNTDQPMERRSRSSKDNIAMKTNEMPNINPTTFDEQIGNITPINGPMEYHDLKGEDGFKPGAKVQVVGGELTMVGDPKFNFHEQKITVETKTYWPDVEGDDIIVTDTLGEDSEGWTLTLQDLTKKPSSTHSLFNNLYYVKEKGTAGKHLTADPQIVAASTDSTDEVVNVTGSWVKGETGLKATIPVQDQALGTHKSLLGWSLVKGVPNSDG